MHELFVAGQIVTFQSGRQFGEEIDDMFEFQK
jgi:hypothetical protein